MALPATADFNNTTGADQALATNNANFTMLTGSLSVDPAKDFVGGAGGGDNAAIWNADAFGADQYAQASVTISSGTYMGLLARASSGVNAYLFYCDSAGYWLSRYNASVETILTSGSISLAAGDVLRLEVSGTGATVTVTGKRALAASPTSFSTIATANDTSGSRITAANPAGLYAFGNFFHDYGLDNFEAGNLATATVLPQQNTSTGRAAAVAVTRASAWRERLSGLIVPDRKIFVPKFA